MTMARYSTMVFAQFTSMLIDNVFDALISANIRQTEAYIQLVEAVGQTLQNFIANTQNAISQEEITQFLAPLANVADGENLIDADVTRVNDALAFPDDAGGCHAEQQSSGSGHSGRCRGGGYTAGSRETIGETNTPYCRKWFGRASFVLWWTTG